MLTRPGSEPGPEWMRRLVNGSDPRRLRRMILRIVIILGLIQMTAVIAGDIAVYRAHGQHVQSYNSPIQIAGMPLVSVGGRAHGVIAYGGVATGIIAVGGLSAGVIAFGGLSVGIFGFGGLSLAAIAVAPVAIGWRAIGAVAIGDAAVGALAIGRCAYAGPGVALGRDEASGGQKESLWG
jgi:hypothetical protein